MNGIRKRDVSLLVFVFWWCVISASLFAETASISAQNDVNCVSCHRVQKNSAGKVVPIYETSSHSRVGVGCSGCHGGDSTQSEKSRAHARNFVAKPDTAATLQMCGRCHREALEFFKGSRHVAARPDAPRLDCAECHGVHAIGAASESFRWPQFCAGCHGLEYLPQLPKPFQEMLALADDLREGLHRLEASGRVPDDLIRRRKEIRHMISELVHKSDSKSGVDRIPRILESGAMLKQAIASAEKK